MLSRGEHVVAIPGTRSPKHLAENFASRQIALPAETIAEIDSLMSPDAIAGERYAAGNLAEVDTERF